MYVWFVLFNLMLSDIRRTMARFLSMLSHKFNTGFCEWFTSIYPLEFHPLESHDPVYSQMSCDICKVHSWWLFNTHFRAYLTKYLAHYMHAEVWITTTWMIEVHAEVEYGSSRDITRNWKGWCLFFCHTEQVWITGNCFYSLPVLVLAYNPVWLD